ncbi:MAG: O-antigen ligase family protein [Ignavibacteriales bacterium]|nr:O-antigen ligase family protein [Ignavibacteriales bacterium]
MTSNLNEVARNILNIIGVITLAFIYIRENGFKLIKFKELPTDLKIFLLVVLISLFSSTLLSSFFTLSLKTLIQQLIFFLLCYFLYSFIKEKKDIYIIIISLLFASLVVGLGVLYQLAYLGFKIFLVESNSIVRVSGIYNNPNAVGLLYASTIPFAFSILFIPFSKKWSIKLLFIVSFLFLLFILIITNSRSSMLSVFISFVYIFYSLRKKLFMKVLKPVVIICILILILPQVQDFLSILFRADRIFSNTREYFWSVAFNIIKTNPIFGVGPGVFEEYIYKYLPVTIGSFVEHQMQWAKSGTAHNFFLFRMADLGILGLVSAVWLFALILKYSKKVIEHYKSVDNEMYILGVTIKGIFLGLLARAFFESTGLLTHGWITRDLPFWLIFIITIFLYKNINVNKTKLKLN